MCDKSSITLAGDMGPAAKTLVEKVSDAVGGLCKPWQVKRVAKAEAEAALIEANNQIQITDLQRRAMHRFVEEEAQKQKNMEDIIEMAIPLLDENADASKIENDWVTNFFDKSRIVSDKDMQELWAKILAGEANKPGKFSKRTIGLISDLDKKDAEMFANLCRYSWMFTIPTLLVFDFNDSIYLNHKVNFGTICDLESIGLVQIQVSGYIRKKLSEYFIASYFDNLLKLRCKPNTESVCPLGKVKFSQTGEELYTVCQSKPVPGFIEYVMEKWKQYSPVLIKNNHV